MNISKKDRTFKIHIVVMTKDDAAEVREALSAESISYLMLTSDCLQSEKEDTMLAWEERDEQCMVSTIVDGIDNGAVEDVFVYRASYCLFRLIQSLGRIRPARQKRIMRHFTSLTLDMIRQDLGTSNIDLMISR